MSYSYSKNVNLGSFGGNNAMNIIQLVEQYQTNNDDYTVTQTNEGKIQVVLGSETGNTTNSKTTTKTISEIRDWIIERYNWSGIVKMMKFLSEQGVGFTYQVPTNLGGVSADNSLIIPDAAIIAIVKVQLDAQIETYGSPVASNYESILSGVDGLPDTSFVTNVMEETSENTLMDESDNDEMTLANGTELSVPNFESASQTEVYNYCRNVVMLRNGLWSDETGVVNIVGIRRSLETQSPEFNDSIIVCWKSAGDWGIKINHAKIYVTTSEQGDLNSDRGMVAQTLQLNLGYHYGRQPAGRTNHLLIKDENGVYDFDKGSGAGMNFHNGGYGIQIGGMSEDGLVGYRDAETSEQVDLAIRYFKLFDQLAPWGTKSNEKTYGQLKKITELELLEVKSTSEESVVVGKVNNNTETEWKTIDVSDAIDWIAEKYSGSKAKAQKLGAILDTLDTLAAVLESVPESGLTVDQIKQLVTHEEIRMIVEQQATYLSEVSKVDGRPGNSYIKLMASNPETLSDKIVRAQSDKETIDDLLSELTTSKSNYIKRLKFDTKDERTKYGTGPNGLLEQNTDNSNRIDAGVGVWSEGCQVVYGAEKFYDLMNKIIGNVNETGQTRWYYNLID